MPNYYNKTNFERKDIAQKLIDLWVETNNPKLGEYALTPEKPAENAVWEEGVWIIPPAPTYTAEEHLAAQGYTPLRLLTCLDLEAKLRAVGKSSPKLASVRSWLDSILGKFALNPVAKPDWEESPHNYEETIQEAVMALTHGAKE